MAGILSSGDKQKRRTAHRKTGRPPGPSKIFVSYSHKDASGLATRLQRDLSDKGFDVWLDVSRIRGGNSWSAEIEHALDQSDIVLALMSAASFVSDVCRGEQLRALRNGKCVIPLLAQQAADRPVYLESTQYRDFSVDGRYQEGLKQLLSDIAERRHVPLIPHYRTTEYDTVPPLPPNYIERGDLLIQLRNAVLSDDTSRQVAITGVRGMGGVGKTVIVQALCRRDEVVQAAFPDGIAWVTIGQQLANLVTPMRDVARALGESTVGFDTLDQSVKRLRAILRDKAALIVLDDVWDAQSVEPFRCEAPRCRLIFTTREASVAAAMGAFEHSVDVMGLSEAAELLARYARTTTQSLPPEAYEVIQECGRLPLAVAMVGAMVRGKTDRWRNLLQKLRTASLGQIKLKFPFYPHPDLLRAIQISVDALEPQLRDRYYELAVIPRDTPIPEAALEALWNSDRHDVQSITDRFVDASLAGRNRLGHLTLHDLQHDYIFKHAEGTNLVALNHKLLDAYALKCNSQWHAGPKDGYFFQHLLYHLHQVGRDPEIQAILLNCEWLQTKLTATDVPQTLSDFERYANTSDCRLVQEALQLSAHVLDTHQEQLIEQLFARLYDVDSPPVQEMLSRARRLKSDVTWLEPVLSCLAKPGDPLVRTIKVNEDIYSIAITPDATLALSGGKTLRLWDLKTGKELAAVGAGIGPFYAVAIAPDGSRAVALSRVLTAWDLQSCRELAMVRRSGPYTAVAMTPDGKESVTASVAGRLEIWELDSGQKLHAIQAHEGEIHALGITLDGRRVVSAGADKTLKVWGVETGRQLGVLHGHHDEVRSVMVTADGTRLVSGALDGTLKYWDLESCRELCSVDLDSIERDYLVEAVAAVPNGKRAASASYDRSLTIWNLESCSPVRTWLWHDRLDEDDISSDPVAITPDCRRAISFSHKRNLQLWNLERGEYVDSLKGHDEEVTEIIPNFESARFVSVSRSKKTVKLWDVESAQNICELMFPRDLSVDNIEFDYLEAAAVGPRTQLLVAQHRRPPEMWDMLNAQRLGILNALGDRVVSAVMTPDGRCLLCGSYRGPLELWDLVNNERMHTLHRHSEWYVAAIAPDGKYAVASVSDSKLRLWELGTGKIVRTFTYRGGWRVILAISADGKRIVAGSDGCLQVWDLRTGEEICHLQRNEENVYGAVLTDDGRYALSRLGNKVIVWSLEQAMEVCDFQGDAPFTCCSCSRDGSLLMAGDSSGGVHAFRLHCASA